MDRRSRRLSHPSDQQSSLTMSLVSTLRRGVHGRMLALISILMIFTGLAVWKISASISTQSHFKQGQLALERDQPVEALLHLQLYLAERPHDPEATFLAARAARRSGDPSKCWKYLREAEALGQPADALELERALAKAAESSGLDWVVPVLLKNSEGDQAAEIVSFLVPIYLAQFRIVEVGKWTAKWVELRPGSAKAWAYHADVLYRLQRTSESINAYRRLLKLDPCDSGAKIKLARLLVELHQPLGEAITHLDELLAAEPGNAPALIQLAACREAEGQFEAAAALLASAIAMPGCDAIALHAMGRLEMQRLNPKAALEYLRRGLVCDPADVELLYTLVLCLNQSGATKEEIRAAEERWKLCKVDLKRTGELTRLISASPFDPELRREIGELFLRNNRATEGIRWLESALKIDPAHSQTRRVLAEHYERTGQPGLANRHKGLAVGSK